MTPHSPQDTPRYKQLYLLSYPIILGQLSQSLTSLIDTVMVAALDDSAALAAVAIGSYASFLACALVLGFSVSVQALVARQEGKGSSHEGIKILNAGMQLSLVTGLSLTLFFYYFAPEVIGLLNKDPLVIQQATEYFRYRCLGITALGCAFVCRGYWNGKKKTRLTLYILLLSQCTNILTSYGFIFGNFGFPQLYAPGSGLGSSLGFIVGACCYMFISYRNQWRQLFQFLPKENYRRVIQLGLPSSAQQFSVALGMSVFYYYLGLAGVDSLAIGHALINIALFITLPAHGFGIAATTLVSHAIGQGQFRQAYLWGWHSIKYAMPILVSLSLLLWAFPEEITRLFMPDQMSIYELAKTPILLTSLLVLIQSTVTLLSQALLGAGQNKKVLHITTSTQWLFFLPCTALAVSIFDAGINTLWGIQILDRLLQLLIFCYFWYKRQWLKALCNAK